MFIVRAFLTLSLAMAACLIGVQADAMDQIDEPVILVATPELRDRLYGTSVLIVTPIGNGQHVGFIVNYPTNMKLSQMFPEHEPSKQVTEPVFLGGPSNREALFALVQRQGSTGGRSIKLAPDLYLEMEREKVDHVIENEYRNARFFAGVVVWRPGELAAEIRSGYWYVQAADAEVVLRKSTTGLWEELIKRIERNRHTLTAGVSPTNLPESVAYRPGYP